LSGHSCARSVSAVTEFLVELYVSATEAEGLTHRLGCARVAAELQRAQGVPVRYVRSILVPEEETCFVFYDAPSREAVGETARLANLAFVSIAAAQTTEAET
jgi:uncharacterized protein DUF4242